MDGPRACRVRASLERPPAAPGCTLPVDGDAQWWPGRVLDWRWADRDAGTWRALVEYSRAGLLYCHWVDGDLLEVEPHPAGEAG